MINSDEYTNKNKIEHNSKWPYIPDQRFKSERHDIYSEKVNKSY